MNRNFGFYLCTLIAFLLITGCGNEEKKTAPETPVSPKKPVLMDPFRFHEMIEVSPGQNYDVLSWGRGSTTVGAFMILHSDSAAAKYTTTTGDLDGAIVDAYNADMDMDGNPEILIQAKGKDTVNYTNIYAFEFSNNKVQKLDFPKLTKSQKKGYRGNDNFYIKDGKFIREFPIYSGDGKEAKPTNQKRQLEYGLRNNEFTVRQLSKDSTEVTKTRQVVAPPAKNAEPAKTTKSAKKHTAEKKSTKKSNKHAPEPKHKKKRRHRSE